MTVGLRKDEPTPRVVYADIINMPHHQSDTRPHMSMYNRAAQFSSFDALAGYSDMVVEEARPTESQVVLDEDSLERLNQKLTLIADVIEDGNHPEITVTYFVPDEFKSGGEYTNYTGKIKRIDTVARKIVFYADNGRSNGKAVDIESVIDIHGELVDYLDDAVIDSSHH